MPYTFDPGTSAAVRTRTSPGCVAVNPSRSPSVNRACGWGDRTTRSVSAGQSLDGRDLAAVRLAHRHEAGAHLVAVEAHRAGAAVAGIAADLRAGQAQVLAQHVHEPPTWVGVEHVPDAVDRERDAGHRMV